MFSASDTDRQFSVRGLLLAAVTCLASALAAASPPQRIAPVVVASVAGDVRVASGGAPLRASSGMTLQLPASIQTGAGGSIELRQGMTIVNVGANSQVEIPVSGDPDETLDRIIQARGNVYYDVAKRAARKLRVETPYLVAVIKGTRFNVSATDALSTVSLFEGVIELRSDKGADAVEISSGQIGSASAAQPRLRVLRMDTGDVIRASTPAAPIDATGSTAADASSPNAPNAAASATAAVASNRSEAALPAAGAANARVTAEVPVAPRILVSNAASSSPTADRGGSMLALEVLASRSTQPAGGSANANTGGSANANTGGSANANTGGSANANTGGSANANTGGSANANTGGSANANANAGGSTSAALPNVVQVIQDLARGAGNSGSSSNGGGSTNGGGGGKP